MTQHLPIHQTDWLSRVTIPDVYPRKDDPFRPGVVSIPGLTEQQIIEAASPPPEVLEGLEADLTTPGQRPFVFQRATTFVINLIANTPQAIMANQFACDSMLLNVYSTAANSVFFGFGNAVTPTTGIEIRPGIPVLLEPENVREQWEVQRVLEYIAALLATQTGAPALGHYRAPRVVFDASDWFLVAAANTAIAVTLFYVPEMQ